MHYKKIELSDIISLSIFLTIAIAIMLIMYIYYLDFKNEIDHIRAMYKIETNKIKYEMFIQEKNTVELFPKPESSDKNGSANR